MGQAPLLNGCCVLPHTLLTAAPQVHTVTVLIFQIEKLRGYDSNPDHRRPYPCPGAKRSCWGKCLGFRDKDDFSQHMLITSSRAPPLSLLVSLPIHQQLL